MQQVAARCLVCVCIGLSLTVCVLAFLVCVQAHFLCVCLLAFLVCVLAFLVCVPVITVNSFIRQALSAGLESVHFRGSSL